MKTKTINIYIDENTKKLLSQFCGKHHISYSTCIDKLLASFIMLTGLRDQLKNDYLKKGNKTSVKVKDTFNIVKDLENAEKAKIYTNILYLYFSKKLKEYMNPKQWETRNNNFSKNIQKCTEDYWNYNNHLRNEARLLKNKNTRAYLKKKLESYERRA